MSKTEIEKTAQIRINVGLNADRVPVHLEWEADEQADDQARPCKAVLISLFERETMETLKIDLWTQDMQVAEMDRMMFHTLRSLADTYLRSSNHVELSREFQQFAHYFGEKTGIVKSEKKS